MTESGVLYSLLTYFHTAQNKYAMYNTFRTSGIRDVVPISFILPSLCLLALYNVDLIHDLLQQPKSSHDPCSIRCDLNTGSQLSNC